jgi:hypothetical protein
MFGNLFLAMSLVSVSALAQKRIVPNPPRPSPEIMKTVQSMNGTWTGRMTARIPEYPAETFDWRMVCRTVAEGAGVSCANSGKASIGSMSESCLLAFDPEGKAVHYMCVTSMGEVHDHKGTWVDDRTIEFEPLHAGLMGQPIVETLRWQFPDAFTIYKTSEVKLANGQTLNFEFRGRRSKMLLLQPLNR